MAPQDGLTATLTRAETTAPTLQRSAPLLRVDGLSVSYGPHEVVSDVGFELGRGQSLALIGASGSGRPALLVADEPTSALDVTIQKRILDLLSRLQHELDISLLLITHDLAIATERANSLVVLKDGVIEEAGRTASIFSSPRSAYARKLYADVPALNPERYAELRDPGFRRLKTDAGETPKIE